VEWICLAEDRVELPVHVNMAMNCQVPERTGNISISSVITAL
jgi:hypothetical protein